MHHDDDRDLCGEMIAWLDDKSQDVRFFVADGINWDNGVPVLEWIVSQPQCDRAIAALVYWLAEPSYHLRTADDPQSHASEGLALIRLILRNWEQGFYRTSELHLDISKLEGLVRAHRAAVKDIPADKLPFTTPAEFEGPFHGRRPEIPDELHPHNNAYIRDLFYALGTSFGRPGIVRNTPVKPAKNWLHGLWLIIVATNHPFEFDSEQELQDYIDGKPKALATRRRQVRARLAKVLKVYGTGFGLLFVVLMTIAIVMRRINYGVWF